MIELFLLIILQVELRQKKIIKKQKNKKTKKQKIHEKENLKKEW